MFNYISLQYIKVTVIIAGLLLPLNAVLAKALIDPTRPPGVSFQLKSSVVPKKSLWRLNSTLIASSRRSARINGKLVRQGDSVNGARIIDIQAWDVTLKRNNKTFKIYMFNKKVYKRIVR
ncbi:MAG: hypothetical protein ACC657_01895 [Thiohalomonadales bacterium]